MDKKLIIYKLANKYDLPLSKIEQVVNYQFKYLANTIKEGNFDAVRLPYFGIFFVKEGRLSHIIRKTNEKNST